MKVHRYSQAILESRGTDSRVPINVKGDGNCLFHSASVAISGDEMMSFELKVRTCIELVSNLEYYRNHCQYNEFILISDDLEEVCLDCATDGEYSSIFTMQALSSVLGREIVSVYPAMNGMLDKCNSIMNTVLQPRIPSSRNAYKGRIYLMWTRMSGCLQKQRNTRWSTNHFVPLLQKSPTEFAIDSECDSDNSDATINNTVPLKTSSPKNANGLVEENSPCTVSPVTTPPLFDAESCNTTSVIEDERAFVSLSDADRLPSRQEIDPQTTPSLSSLLSNATEEQSKSDCSEEFNKKSPPVNNNKLNGRFLDVDSLCEHLQHGTDVKSSIPKGPKEDVYFLIENEYNMGKRMRGKRSNFEDDCGAWLSKSSSTKKTVFHHFDDKFKAIEMKNGKYCIMRMKEWVPLEPQPRDEEVVIMRRFYATLKRQTDYKKRVTWIEKASSEMDANCQGKAVVEYLGTFPPHASMHGNSKKGSGSEYIRTSEATKEKIKQQVTCAPPRNVYTDMVLEDSLDAPRDLKQVQNIKQANAQQKRGSENNRKNTADDIQTIINMMNDHPFIQEIVQTKGKPPMVILYTEDQLKEVRNFCVTKSNKSILGVDRTFNLGACFVTLTVFKNTHLLRRSSQSSPVMLGPLFLHWDGTCCTYQRFFSHLRTKLDANISTEVGLSNIIVGSDEEKAILKAVQQSFPTATQILCQRHLEENVRRYLQRTVGTPEKIRNEVVSLIFGNDGLVNAKDLVEFELKVLSLSNTLLDIAPNFVAYFDDSLVPRVREYVYQPQISANWIPLNWTNNNCESLNNILKLSTNWKVLKLPDLIEKMYAIVKLQYADMRRALHGHGNYQVIPQLKSFVLSNTAWCQKNEAEKVKHFQKFISVSTVRKENVLTSTDGELRIPKTPSIARKPGQRKRVRNAKTHNYRGKRVKIAEQ